MRLAISSLFLLAVVTFAHAQNVKNDMHAVFIQNASQRKAVANDGSDAMFYFSRGSDPKLFLLHFEGGWWCYSNTSCAQRWAGGKEEMSSKYLPKTATTKGYYGRDCFKNIAWCKANMIAVPYLSSDGYVGDTGPTPELPWHFRGSRIVRAIFQDLFAGTDGGKIKIPPGSRIVLVGESAGGCGVLWNCQMLGDLVKSLCPDCDFVCVPDSGFFVGDLAIGSGYPPSLSNKSDCDSDPVTCYFGYEVAIGYSAWNASLDPTCLATMAALKRSAWHCMFGQVALLFTGPYRTMVLQYLFDMAEMTADGLLTHPYTPASIEILAEIIAIKRASFNHHAHNKKGGASFLPSCTGHMMSRGLSGQTAGGVTLNVALDAWYNLGVDKDYSDKCSSMDCRHCPGGPGNA